jgi:hypothetical protein
MNANHDLGRRIADYYEAEAPPTAPDGMLRRALAIIDTTAQRRAIRPAWRRIQMNTYAKLAVAAAAVVVVALAGISLMPRIGGIGATPTPTSSPSPTPSPSPQVACDYSPGCLPPEMRPPRTELVIGKEYNAAAGNYGFGFTVPATGWYARVSDPIGSTSVTRITKRIAGKEVAQIIAWDPDRVYVDPCNRQFGPNIGPSAADFASALLSISGTDSSGPEELPRDAPGGFGFGAQYIEIVVRESADCAAADFYLWSDGVGHLRVPSAVPSTIRVWVLDLSGHIADITGMQRMVIESELMNGAGPDVDQEIDQILDSLGFPG